MLEFLKALMGIGKKLQGLPSRELRSEYLLNDNFYQVIRCACTCNTMKSFIKEPCLKKIDSDHFACPASFYSIIVSPDLSRSHEKKGSFLGPKELIRT